MKDQKVREIQAGIRFLNEECFKMNDKIDLKYIKLHVYPQRDKLGAGLTKPEY